MGDFLNVNLIPLFTFYLTAAFIVGTFRRLGQYRTAGHLVAAAPGRWPRVVNQMKRHWVVFLTWAIFRPAALAIGLIIIQMICSRVIWPQAKITPRDLQNEWWMIPVLGVTGLAMLGVDLYGIIRVGRIDRDETVRYLDEAEHWLTSWKGPVVAVLTLGYINPRKMVDTEVRKALQEGSSLLKQTLWWVSLQASCRLLFGLALWTSWALLPSNA